MLIYLLAAGLFEALRNADAHVANVAWRLQTANASVCRDLSPSSGLVLQTLDQYVPPERAEAARFGLNDVPQINAVASGSMAERAGLNRVTMSWRSMACQLLAGPPAIPKIEPFRWSKSNCSRRSKIPRRA